MVSYTLINAASVAFELAHLPAGPSVAHVLLTGLTADPATLHDLADRAAHTPAHQNRSPRPVVELRTIHRRLPAEPAYDEIQDALRVSRLNGPRALENMIRHEILGPENTAACAVPTTVRERAADLIVDTALSAWAIVDGQPELHPSCTQALPPLPSETDPHTPCADLGPHTAAVRDLLGSLLVPTTRRSWQTALPSHHTTWAHAMHRAGWAAHLSGRVRATACAQFMAVLAFRRTGFGPAEVTSGTWTALSGTLQAVVVHDLLDQTSADTLLAPAYGQPCHRPMEREL